MDVLDRQYQTQKDIFKISSRRDGDTFLGGTIGVGFRPDLLSVDPRSGTASFVINRPSQSEETNATPQKVRFL